MPSVLNRLADRMLTRLVPQADAEAATTCPSTKTVRFCFCSQGLKRGKVCRYFHYHHQCIWGCESCTTYIGAC